MLSNTWINVSQITDNILTTRPPRSLNYRCCDVGNDRSKLLDRLVWCPGWMCISFYQNNDNWTACTFINVMASVSYWGEIVISPWELFIGADKCVWCWGLTKQFIMAVLNHQLRWNLRMTLNIHSDRIITACPMSNAEY